MNIEKWIPNEEETKLIIKSESFFSIMRSNPIVIKNNQDFEKFKQLSLDFKDLAKSIESRRKMILEPIQIEVKRVNTILKTPADELDDYSKKCMAAVGNYANEIARKKREEERTRLEAEANKLIQNSPEEQPAKMFKASKTIEPEISGVSMVKRWVFEIKEPNKIPGEYYSVDEQKIRAAIAAGVRTIPGVSIYQDETAARR